MDGTSRHYAINRRDECELSNQRIDQRYIRLGQLYLRFRDGKTYRQIGPLVGRSYEWVRMELPKILAKLRRLMR